jgi:hypothetical protein
MKLGCQANAPAAFNRQEISLVLISVRGWRDHMAIVRPEELSQRKIQMAPMGIDPATWKLLVQRLNQLCYRVLSSGIERLVI